MTEQEKQALRMERVKTLFALSGQAFFDFAVKYFRDGSDPGPGLEMRQRIHVEDNELCGRRWFKLTSKEKTDIPCKTKKIMYLHGGGYVMETVVAQLLFAEFLANQTGSEVWFPEYPLIPESECLHAMEMTSCLYRKMLETSSADEIAIMGDSAGGGIAASLAIYLKELVLPQPNNLILISPGTNQMHRPRNQEEEEELRYLATQDDLLHLESFPTIIESWTRKVGIDDYRGNSVCGDYTDLAPILVFAGGSELMSLQIRGFVDVVRHQGADITYIEKNLCGHEFMV